ncbi:hypothetical protein K525DRAFT_264154 [Schizophyllum commune Loenen D]|nr:hypothetical protein K525DRAFT_264154 [Schizophyllum commune Loenen D]
MSYTSTNSQFDFDEYLYAPQLQEPQLRQRSVTAALYATQLQPEIAAHDDLRGFPPSLNGLWPCPSFQSVDGSHLLVRSSSAHSPIVCPQARAEFSDADFAPFMPATQLTAAAPGVDLRLGSCQDTQVFNGHRDGSGIPSPSSRGSYEFDMPHTRSDDYASGAGSFYTAACPAALWPSPEAVQPSFPTPNVTATDVLRMQSRDHMRRHANELEFKCPVRDCNAAFNTENDLKSHRRRMHGGF